MPALTETVLSFVSFNIDRLLLLLPLAIAFGLSWSRWRRHGAADARRVCQAAAVFLALLLAWLVAAGLMAIAGVDPLLWAPPLDRLLGVIGVAALGWLWVQLPPPYRARWHAFLAVGFAVTLVAYLVWAPAWAGAWREDPAGAGGGMVVGLRRAWDAWLLALALLLALLIARPGARVARWALVLAGCLVAGGLLDLLAPLPDTYLPAWARLGLFAAGGCVVAVFLRQALLISTDSRLTTGNAVVDPLAPADPTVLVEAGMSEATAATEAMAATEATAAPGESGPTGGAWTDETATDKEPGDLVQSLRLDVALLTARLDRVEADLAFGASGSPLGLSDVPALTPPPTEVPGIDPHAEANGSPNGARDGAPAAETVLDWRPVDPAVLRRLAQALIPALIEALQTPMNQIRAYRDVLLHGSSLREEQVHRYVYRIDANLARLQGMLDTLVTVLSVPDRAPPAAASVQIAPLVRAALDRAEPELREKGLTVRVEVEDTLPAATVDSQALARMVDNLLHNASRRSPQGGELTVRAAMVPGGPIGELVISVHDWGARVSDAMLGAIESQSGEDADLPVDLKVVHFLAACQGGRLWAENRTAGAGFFAGLPLRRIG